MKLSCFDTANATAFAGDPVSLLDRVIERVVTVRAADTRAYARDVNTRAYARDVNTRAYARDVNARV